MPVRVLFDLPFGYFFWGNGL